MREYQTGTTSQRKAQANKKYLRKMEVNSGEVAEKKPINVPNSIKISSLNPSLASSVDNVIYPPSHQYHYIQYYQQMPLQQQKQYQIEQQHLYANPTATLLTPSNTCQCSCSCGNQAQQLQMQQQLQKQQKIIVASHSHQSSVDSQMVNVIVHRQASGSNSCSSNENTSSNINTNSPSISPTTQNITNNHNPALSKKSQSETSLLSHSYQALKMSESLTESIFDGASGEKKNLRRSFSCDCDLECTCAENDNNNEVGADKESISNHHKHKIHHSHHSAQLPHKQQFLLSEAMLTADEITVSESDNNSTTVKRCERNQNNKSTGNNSRTDDSNYRNANNIDIYSDGDPEAITEACLKETNGMPHVGTSDLRPPLPPRPPPRPKLAAGSSNAARARSGVVIKKYVVWCLVCGGFSCILGMLFLGVYFLLHSYTITVGNFETVPTFVPATLLILTGLCVMSLARRRNRYSYLIKLSGACGLISALTCALVTVTTTVLHMSRLQALRECEYAQKTRTCTCYSDLIESQVDRVDKEGVRLVFDSLSDCGVVHGSLYSCLRAIFGLSVAGVLVAVFSCMLVYQLLSHERKKMYWEQLELRCRSLYTRPQMPTQNMATVAAPHGCRCCEQCHAHRQVPMSASSYPWDESAEPRFWSTQPPGNFYSPNPGGEDLSGMVSACRGHEMSTTRSRGIGWSWNRWWQRSSPDPSTRFRQTTSSPDSQYGFSNSTNIPPTLTEEVITSNPGQFNVLPNNLPYGVWGPPPPYSDPNSPARRGYYQYIQPPHHINATNIQSNVNNMINISNAESAHSQFLEQPAVSNCCQQSSIPRSTNSGICSVGNFKSKGEYENTPSDSDCGTNIRERDRFSNTLPTRKIKKRLDPGNKSIGPNSQSSQRINVQQVFANANQGADEQEYQEPQSLEDGSLTSVQINKCGVENNGFQNSSESTNVAQNVNQHTQSSSDHAESEVYFADVSSCCNISVKNDHYYEDTRASQRTLIPKNQQHHTHGHSHHHHHTHNISAQQQHQHQLNNSSNSSNEDYLAQRFGQRENSVRSRLPFPQNSHVVNDGFVENLKILTINSAKDSQLINHSHIPKDTSRQSMCSVESEPKTEFTDLSPLTPCSNKNNQMQDFVEASSQGATTPTNFVASYPFSSESQSLEAHRRSTKNLTEAHYEIIDDHQTSHQISRNIVRTTNKPKTPIKPTVRERKDNSDDRDWSSDNSNGERNRL